MEKENLTDKQKTQNLIKNGELKSKRGLKYGIAAAATAFAGFGFVIGGIATHSSNKQALENSADISQNIEISQDYTYLKDDTGLALVSFGVICEIFSGFLFSFYSYDMSSAKKDLEDAGIDFETTM